MVSDALLMLRVSPVLTVFDALRAADHRKFPAVEASKNETCETTSPFVPAQLVNDGVLDNDRTPVVEALNVAAWRVVTDDTEVVPAVPGLAVCNCTYTAAGAVYVVPAAPPRMTFSQELDNVVDTPTAIRTPQ
jgi:hypothetical protein